MIFSPSVLALCLFALFALTLYTFLLLRAGKLTPHITLRWLLTEGVAIVAVILWGRLPFISMTSMLNDRELLVVLAVIFFSLFIFLILESQKYISKHTNQIRRLSQEIALLRAQLEDQGQGGPLTRAQEGRFDQVSLPCTTSEGPSVAKTPVKTADSGVEKGAGANALELVCLAWVALIAAFELVMNHSSALCALLNRLGVPLTMDSFTRFHSFLSAPYQG